MLFLFLGVIVTIYEIFVILNPETISNFLAGLLMLFLMQLLMFGVAYRSLRLTRIELDDSSLRVFYSGTLKEEIDLQDVIKVITSPVAEIGSRGITIITGDKTIKIDNYSMLRNVAEVRAVYRALMKQLEKNGKDVEVRDMLSWR